MLAAAVVLSVAFIGAAPVALAAGPSVSLILTPDSATITAGQSQEYHATIYETNGQEADVFSSDVTSSTTFTIADGTCTDGTCTPAPDGSCTTTDPKTCTATATGRHTITGTVTYQAGDTTGTATATATLDVQPGPPVSLTLSPNPGSITAGTNQPYQATGKDAYGNSFDVTSSTTFTIAPDGSCTPTDPKTCTATIAGPHTVTGTYTPAVGINASGTTGAAAAPGSGVITGTASLDVQPGPPVSLTLSPNPGSITAGTNQPYQATGKDAYGNSFDVTSSTTFTIAPDGSCTPTDPKTCTATIAGPHTVTGTYTPAVGINASRIATPGDGAIIATASLDVRPGPPVRLTLTPNPGSITAGTNQPYQATGKDAYGNSFDVTSSTTFTISPDGSCTDQDLHRHHRRPPHRHRHHRPGRWRYRDRHRHPASEAWAAGQPDPASRPGHHHRREQARPTRPTARTPTATRSAT